MHIKRFGFLRKVSGGLLAGIALFALAGCYPYYYDLHYTDGGGHYNHGYHGEQSYYHGGHDYNRHHRRDRHRRYRHYRGD